MLGSYKESNEEVNLQNFNNKIDLQNWVRKDLIADSLKKIENNRPKLCFGWLARNSTLIPCISEIFLNLLRS